MFNDRTFCIPQHSEVTRLPVRGMLFVLVLCMTTMVTEAQQPGRKQTAGSSGRNALSPELARRLENFGTSSSATRRTTRTEPSETTASPSEQMPDRDVTSEFSERMSAGRQRPAERLPEATLPTPLRSTAEESFESDSVSSEDATDAGQNVHASWTSEEDGEQNAVELVADTVEQLDVTAEPDSAPFLDLTDDQSSQRTSNGSPGQSHPEVTMNVSPGSIIVRAATWMVIVFCLLTLTILGVRRWQRSRGLLPTAGAKSRVLETLSVGPGRTVSLIELGGIRAFVAADAGGIRALVLTPMPFQDELSREMETEGNSLVIG